MHLSIWEYVRARARDAVLAGVHDALDIVEQGDTNGKQSESANKLVAKLAATEAAGLPEPSRNGNGQHPEAEARNGTPESHSKPTEPAGADDDLEERLHAAASQRAEERPGAAARNVDGQSGVGPTESPEAKPTFSVPPGRITNRKRGRPPKNRQDGD